MCSNFSFSYMYIFKFEDTKWVIRGRKFEEQTQEKEGKTSNSP